MYAVINICILVLSSICLTAVTLGEHGVMDHNYIQQTEKVIGETLNLMFYSLGLKNLSETAKTKKYISVHSYFTTLTLQDYNYIQDVANVTRVEKGNLSNSVAILNDIFNEDSVFHLLRITMGTEDGWGVDPRFELEKLKYMDSFFKERYIEPTNFTREAGNKMYDDSAEAFISSNNLTFAKGNQVKNNFRNVSDENEFWHEGYTSGRRLYQGMNTKIKIFPFMASIEMFNKFHCGGSIIQSDLILTAASCLQLAWNNRYYRENPAFIQVRVGSTFYEIGGDAISVLEIYFYPDYNPQTLHHNIAVLRLIRSINFAYKQVKKIKLDDEIGALPTNIDKITVLGWGISTKPQKASDHKLRFADLQVYILEDCQDIYSKKYVTRFQNFCAGYITSGKGACNRDIGGPGVNNGRLTGIISFGAPVCGTPDAPTVFVKIGYYNDWLEQIMEQESLTLLKRTTTVIPKRTYYTTTEIKEVKKLRQQNHVNVSIFKNLLKTMFESKEIEEYVEDKRKHASSPPKPPIARTLPALRPFDLVLNSNQPQHHIVYPIPEKFNDNDQQSNCSSSDQSELEIASMSEENGKFVFPIDELPNNTPRLPLSSRPAALKIPKEQVSISSNYQDNKITSKKVNVRGGHKIQPSVSQDPDKDLIERIKIALVTPQLTTDYKKENTKERSGITPMQQLPPVTVMNQVNDDVLENAVLTLVYMSSNEADNVARTFDDDVFYDAAQAIQNKIRELGPNLKFKFDIDTTNKPDSKALTPFKNDNQNTPEQISEADLQMFRTQNLTLSLEDLIEYHSMAKTDEGEGSTANLGNNTVKSVEDPLTKIKDT